MKKLFILIIIASVFSGSCSSRSDTAKNHVFEVTNPEEDFTPKVTRALANDRDMKIILEFKQGTYHFYPEKATEKYLKVSNNDNGLRRFAFDLQDRNDIHIIGNGSTFIFHGSLIPFLIEESSNVAIEGINIEYDYPFDFQGKVVANNETERTFDLRVHDANKYRIKDDILFFSGYDWKLGLGENIVYDPDTKSPAYFTAKYEHDFNGHFMKAKALDENTIRISNVHAAKVPPVGSIYNDKGPHGQNRNIVGFRIYKSKNITLTDINVYHSGAMALIAEKAENITLRQFNILLKEGSTRVISSNADATHFVNCKGKIIIDNCRFENMLDDATNVHGTYMICDEFLGPKTVALRFGHFQQQGFDFAGKGDSLRFIDRKNILPAAVGVVKEIDMMNENYYIVTLENELPEFEGKDIAVENTTWMPSLEVTNCIVKQNRARSLLISTSKPVLIENNYFASMMAGIRICGDANYWFESGPVSDVVVRGNTFENLGIGGHAPQAILQIDPIIGKQNRKDGYYHRNIIFEENTIRTFDPLIIYALSVDGLVIRNNTIIQTKDYPQIFGELSQFDLQNCKNVIIEGNTYQGDNPASISAIECTEMMITPDQTGFSEEAVQNPNKYFYQN